MFSSRSDPHKGQLSHAINHGIFIEYHQRDKGLVRGQVSIEIVLRPNYFMDRQCPCPRVSPRVEYNPKHRGAWFFKSSWSYSSAELRGWCIPGYDLKTKLTRQSALVSCYCLLAAWAEMDLSAILEYRRIKWLIVPCFKIIPLRLTAVAWTPVQLIQWTYFLLRTAPMTPQLSCRPLP